jgi:hypothetical protein
MLLDSDRDDPEISEVSCATFPIPTLPRKTGEEEDD